MKKLILLLVTTTLFLVGVNAQDVLTTEDMNSVYKKEKHHNKRVAAVCSFTSSRCNVVA